LRGCERATTASNRGVQDARDRVTGSRSVRQCDATNQRTGSASRIEQRGQATSTASIARELRRGADDVAASWRPARASALGAFTYRLVRRVIGRWADELRRGNRPAASRPGGPAGAPRPLIRPTDPLGRRHAHRCPSETRGSSSCRPAGVGCNRSRRHRQFAPSHLPDRTAASGERRRATSGLADDSASMGRWTGAERRFYADSSRPVSMPYSTGGPITAAVPRRRSVRWT
jgi:hypothetical protein